MCKKIQFTSNIIVVLALLVLPLCWVLRDGLGPDATTSTGMNAIVRTFWTFYIGPILITSLAVSLVSRM